MSRSINIALDAMGGDVGPTVVVEAVRIALERRPGVSFLLFGNEAQIAPLVSKLKLPADRVTIRHTDQVVLGDDKPSQALRRGRESSMGLAIAAVAQGAAAGVVSAGNTGALMAMSKFILRTLPGIDRPAIAGILPTLHGESVMLDMGANVDCDSNNLVQFAVMGAAFARTMFGLPRPSVGLLNVGQEELKGNDTVKQAAQALRDADLAMRFHGFVEGDDLTAGTTDVIVTDGFSGNIALKTAEGTVKLYTHFLRQAVSRSLLARIGFLLARGALSRLRDRLDPGRYNGGVLLGLNGICVKSHGSADANSFATAIDVAADMASDDLIERIQADFQRFGGIGQELPARAAAS